jgi:hypothetical protein
MDKSSDCVMLKMSQVAALPLGELLQALNNGETGLNALSADGYRLHEADLCSH